SQVFTLTFLGFRLGLPKTNPRHVRNPRIYAMFRIISFGLCFLPRNFVQLPYLQKATPFANTADVSGHCNVQTFNDRNKISKITTFLTLIILTLTACNNSDKSTTNNKTMIANNKTTTSTCSDNCKAQNKTRELSCKLTTPELQKRKETVIASLKQQILDKKELKDGYAFKFRGTDEVLDELTDFIKTERMCCDFFTFGLSVSGDKREAW